MWAITSFFNPSGYSNKIENLRRFRRESKRQGLYLLVVEVAFGDQPFELTDRDADIVVRKRSDAILWQKERLLNLGLVNVSLHYAMGKTIAWIDADVLFENFNWIAQAEFLLKDFNVVQLFDTAAWLDPSGEIERVEYGTAYEKALGQRTTIGGHTGFAWAARTDILRKHGFYDRDIAGGGDFHMACAMWNQWNKLAGLKYRELFMTEEHLADLDRWSEGFYEDVQGKVSYVPGKVFHLWHGSQKDRDYLNR